MGNYWLKGGFRIGEEMGLGGIGGRD